MTGGIAMSRVAFALTLMFSLAGSSQAGSKKTDDRELIILVLIDAVRADHVGSYGYGRPTTPVLDGLAKEGRRYSRTYVNAPWTRSSTASFLTGLNASWHRTETAKSKLPADVVSLAERLGKVGWTSSGFSANGNGGSMAGLHKGFDLFEDPTNTYKRKGLRARCQKRFGKRIKKADWKAAVLADCVRYNRLPTGEFITHRVLEHLKGSQAKREFLFVFFVDPHDPYGAPAWLEKKFLGDFKGKIRRKALWERNNDYPEDERFSIQAIYDAGIRYADIALGQLVDGLKAQGRWEKTSLFVTADHGEGFGEHGFYLHAHHFWEEVIHVPLVAVGPRFTPQVDERLTQSLDVVSTIAELAGASTKGLPGRSLLEPALAGRRIISEYNEFGIHRQAIMDGRYKVIWQRPADEEWYLREAKKKEFFPSVSFDKEVIRVFDLQTDPQEKRNLVASMPEAARVMLAELRAFVAGDHRTR